MHREQPVNPIVHIGKPIDAVRYESAEEMLNRHLVKQVEKLA